MQCHKNLEVMFFDFVYGFLRLHRIYIRTQRKYWRESKLWHHTDVFKESLLRAIYLEVWFVKTNALLRIQFPILCFYICNYKQKKKCEHPTVYLCKTWCRILNCRGLSPNCLCPPPHLHTKALSVGKLKKIQC